jgi:hypothetical protein
MPARTMGEGSCAKIEDPAGPDCALLQASRARAGLPSGPCLSRLSPKVGNR